MNMPRNRWLIGATTAAVALLTAVAGVAAAGAATSHDTATSQASPIAAVMSAGPTSSSSQRLGAVIATGLDASKISEWVIYGIPVHHASWPGTTFGFTIADLHNDGTTIASLTIYEYQGSDLAPGFHATEAAMNLTGNIRQPAFGYYVGHPTKITIQAGRRTITASSAVWSYNPSVTVFWFNTDQIDGHTKLAHLAAYDKAGHRLTQGRAGIAIG